MKKNTIKKSVVAAALATSLLASTNVGFANSNNASKAHKLFGYPRVSIREMIEWTADWVANDGETINKPTHFQERKGEF